MDEGRKDNGYSGTSIQSGKRGFSLPPMPVTAGAPMPPVNPPKEKDKNKGKNQEQKI